MLAGRATRTDILMDKCGQICQILAAKIAFEVSIVESNSNSLSERSGCNQSFLDANAATRDAEREKVRRCKRLWNQRGLTFVPIIFTTTVDQRGHGRGISATDLAPTGTLEEG
jgi:hypothetical protein